MQFVPKGFAICLFMEAIVFARNPINGKKKDDNINNDDLPQPKHDVTMFAHI